MNIKISSSGIFLEIHQINLKVMLFSKNVKFINNMMIRLIHSLSVCKLWVGFLSEPAAKMVTVGFTTGFPSGSTTVAMSMSTDASQHIGRNNGTDSIIYLLNYKIVPSY